MFQLRGLSDSGEMDCTANPSDPVCQAIYAQTGVTLLKRGSVPAYAQQILASSAAKPPQTAGTNVATGQLPATGLPTIAASVGIWGTIPWWLKLAGIVGIGYVGYTQWYAPTTPKKAG